MSGPNDCIMEWPRGEGAHHKRWYRVPNLKGIPVNFMRFGINAFVYDSKYLLNRIVVFLFLSWDNLLGSSSYSYSLLLKSEHCARSANNNYTERHFYDVKAAEGTFSE